MAAYAALVPVMRIIDTLHLHPRPPISISIHKAQVESLTAKISSLLGFLEAYNPHLGYTTQADPFEARIADAAYAAEDVIESQIVDQITDHGRENISSSSRSFYKRLEKVIEDMGSIEKEAMELQHQLHLLMNSTATPSDSDSVRSSSSSSSIVHNDSMVGVDDLLIQMKDNLTSDRRDLQIIPIVGMGGTGKTTLATKIYHDPLIQEHFHVCAWATISQEYSFRHIFTQILAKIQLNVEVDPHLSEDELADKLHKSLSGWKYLIIMDDMWNIEAWERVKRSFPDSKIGSRIVITTRLSNLASDLHGSNRLEMRLLDEQSSWELLSRIMAVHFHWKKLE